MACYDEVLKAAKAIIKLKKEETFTIKEVREYLKGRNTQYHENTIRGLIVGKCCVDYSKHKFPYFKKVKDKRATYRLA